MLQLNNLNAAAIVAILAVTAAVRPIQAADVTRADIEAWLGTEVHADPPAAGTVIGIDGIDDLSGWLPPGYIDEFRFDDVRVEIQATGDYPGHRS